jgi:hypothetical protein
VFSRYLVIVLAFGVALFRMSQGAWVEAGGLLGLGGGLVILKVGERRPAVRRLAYIGFAVTAISIVTVLLRKR